MASDTPRYSTGSEDVPRGTALVIPLSGALEDSAAMDVAEPLGIEYGILPSLPEPVGEHISSLRSLVTEWQTTDGITPAAARFLDEFAVRHDVGYGVDPHILETVSGHRILRQVLEDVVSPVAAEDIAAYFDTNRDNYLAARILGHGVLGLVGNALHYMEQGIPPSEAIGRSEILAAHHAGFPVTMVSEFATGEAAVTPDVRHGLLIGDAGDDAEVLRGLLAEAAAQRLRISADDATRAAVLGYAADRITPGRLPTEIRVNEAGGLHVVGGEVVQKKYGLVAGDLSRGDQPGVPSVAELYETVNDRLRTEAQAAIQAAQFARQDDLAGFVEDRAGTIAAGTARQQARALTVLDRHGLSGSFENLADERGALLGIVRQTQDPDAAFALATYDAILAQQ